MNYHNKDGGSPSGSVLLRFATAILPPVVSIGYIRFGTRPYNPRPYVATTATGMVTRPHTAAAVKDVKNAETTILTRIAPTQCAVLIVVDPAQPRMEVALDTVSNHRYTLL